MAQKNPIVIFPSLRRSELERDVRDRRAVLDASAGELWTGWRKSIRPLSFVRRHPKFLLGLALTLLSGSKLILKGVRGIFKIRKKRILWKILKAGWFWKLSRLLIKTLLSRKKDSLAQNGLNILKNFVFSRRFK